LNKKEVKKTIEKYEYYNSGIKHTNGAYVDVTNITIEKDKVYADVELVFQMDGRTEKYTNCKYPISMFKKEIEVE